MANDAFGIVIGGDQGNGDIGARQRRVQQRFTERHPEEEPPPLGTMPEDGTEQDAGDLGWRPDYFRQWAKRRDERAAATKRTPRSAQDKDPNHHRNYRQVRQYPEIADPGSGMRPDARGHNRAIARRTTRGVG